MKKVLFLFSMMSSLGIFAGKNPMDELVVCKDQECPRVINSVGEAVTIDVTKLSIQDQGTISQDKILEVQLPENVGEKVAYSFIPSTGESQGKRIYIVLENQEQRPGSRLSQATVIKFYRRFEDEKPSHWIEVGSFIMKKKNAQVEPVKLTIKNDGTVTVTLPTTGKTEVIPLGRRKF
jgi:hypothetical protein